MTPAPGLPPGGGPLPPPFPPGGPNGGGGNGGGIPPYYPGDGVLGNWGAGAGAGSNNPFTGTLSVNIGDVGGTMTGGSMSGITGRDVSTSGGGGLGDLFGEGTGKILLWGGLAVVVLFVLMRKKR